MRSSSLAYLAVFSSMTLLSSVVAQCGQATQTITILGGNPAITSGQYAYVSQYASPTVLACATAEVSPRGQITLSGGTALLYGTSDNPSLRPFAYATVASSQSGYIPTASTAAIYVQPSATATILDGINNEIHVSSQATASITNQVDALVFNSGTITMAGSGNLNFYNQAPDATAVVTFADTQGKSNRFVYVGGGVVSATGSSYRVEVGATATAFAGGNNALLLGTAPGAVITGVNGPTSAAAYALGGGAVTITDGSANTLMVRSSGTGSIAGSGNTATATSGASLTAGGGATVYVDDGAYASISSGIGYAEIASDATAALNSGASVIATDGATLIPESPTLTASPVSAVQPGVTAFTVVARLLGSFARRAAQLPLPTAKPCGNQVSIMSCPDQFGVYHCTNVTTDIFNCGGCAFEGFGTDCTAGSDETLVCVAGACLSLGLDI